MHHRYLINRHKLLTRKSELYTIEIITLSEGVCMQVKKKSVKNRILQSAKGEFLEKGFEKASIRSIAARAKVTKGNIYNYFSSKNDLFTFLVEPAMDIITETMTIEYGDSFIGGDIDDLYTIEESLLRFKEHIESVLEWSDIIKLLFFASSGSSLSDFKEQIISRYEKSSRSFFDVIAQENPGLNGNVTDMFIHSCALLYISLIEEILIHKPDETELKKFIKEMTYFVHYGTIKAMES